METNKIYNEDCLTGLRSMADNSVDCCVTSPPYFGLRDYGNERQIGLEDTPEEYVSKMVEVFEQVRRVLKPEGNLWLNLGDSYAGSGMGAANYPHLASEKQKSNHGSSTAAGRGGNKYGLKPKDLIGIPWMVAFALRSAGYYLRQDIIWSKPNPMPESVTDRCTKAHEYIFLMSKSQKYYYDHEAIKTECKNPEDDLRRITKATMNGKSTPNEERNGIRNPSVGGKKHKNLMEKGQSVHTMHRTRNEHGVDFYIEKANKRSVWTVITKGYSEAHFATFPEDLIVDCIKAGCPEGGLILDPFMGAGTTALVARKLNRNYIGFELNPDYIKIANKRLNDELGMFY
jgi:DNA modification methylase